MGAARTGGSLGRKDGGGEIHGPEKHPGGVEVHSPGGQDAADFGPVTGKVAARVWDTPAENKGATASAGHVVEAGAGVEVMAAADASANGGSPAAQAARKNVVAGTNDEARTHGDLRWVIRSG